MTEREIFIAAAQIESLAERAAFLDRACGSNTSLRDRINGLLAEQDKLGSFLEVPAGAVATIEREPAPSERLGLQIGPYKLLQKLGEGGMGTVWVAEQERPVKRRVALKVIKPGMDSAQVIARFEAERQALALMDHSNIAKVLDAGTTDQGRPYFVMELVKGVAITKYCDELNLPIRERLALFVPVCQAIQHAHQKGIIHRDLKPSNILVAMQDGRPVPKVIDFGVAKALHQPLTERTMMTEFGAVIGTLEYMSPEQAELSALDIDTRADIYALGVLLYELLTGSTPLDRKRLRAAALDEMLRIIREVEPPKPSTRLTTSENLASLAAHRRTEPRKLGAEIRGELDWIVMKALEKDRTRRYETASSFARDIDRFLSDEPVEACPPSTGYRFRKFVKKHFAAISTAAAFALVLIVATIISATHAVRAKRAEAHAKIQRDAATAAAEEAETARNQAESERDRALAAERLASERLQQVAQEKARAESAEKKAAEEADIATAVSEFLQKDLLAQADPWEQAGTEPPPDKEIKLREVLDRAATKIAGRFPDQPLVEAAVRSTIGTAFVNLDLHALAEPHLTAALETRKGLLGEEHSDTLATMRSVGMLLRNRRRFGEAEALLRHTAEIQDRLLGVQNLQSLKTKSELWWAIYMLGRYGECEAMARDLVIGSQALLGEDHRLTLVNQKHLGQALTHLGRYQEAESLQRKVIEHQRRVLGPEHPDTLGTTNDLAYHLMVRGRYEEAERLGREYLPVYHRSCGPHHQWTINATSVFTGVLSRQGKYGEAEEVWKSLLAACVAGRGPNEIKTLGVMNYLVGTYRAAGKLRDATKLAEELRAKCIAALGPDDDLTLTVMNDLGLAYVNTRQFDKAEPLFTEALQRRREVLGEKHASTLTSLHNLGWLHDNQKKYVEAEAAYQQALDLRRQTLSPDHSATLLTMTNLAALYQKQQKLDQADELYREAIEARRRTLGPDHPFVATAQLQLARNLLRQKKPIEAESVILDCLAIRERSEKDTSRVFNAKSMLASALVPQERFTEAESLLLESQEGLKTGLPTFPAEAKGYLTDTLQRLIDLYTAWEKPDEAEKWQKILEERKTAETPAKLSEIP